MKKYVAEERRKRLAQFIIEQGSVRIGTVAEMFGVTNETIRKDLIYLDQQKLVSKKHGGAIAVSEAYERSIHARATENEQLKEQIAKKALEMIKSNSVVILDSGSTILTLAKILPADLKLTVVTNSFPAASVLAETGNSVHVIGGEMSPITMSTSGMMATYYLNMIKADMVFLGSSGFQSYSGPSAKAFCDAQIKKDMMRNSNVSVVLADSTKFVTNAFVQFADWNDIDFLITDSGAPQSMLEEIEKYTKVIVA